MKQSSFILIILFLLFYTHSKSQNIGINTTSPDPTAALDVVSSDKGILIPRTDTSTVNTAGLPATGLMIYQTTDDKFYYYNGAKWLVMTTGDDPVFERNGTTIRQKKNYTDDFIIGRDSLPKNGKIVTNNFMFYDHSKHAFRGGSLYNSPNWSSDSIGVGSFAYGHNVKAIGDHSTAMGNNTDAIGDYSTAMGFLTDATGDYATAMGSYTDATGDYATAMGRSTDATGNYATAMGFHTYAPSYNETTLGRYSTNYAPMSSTAWSSGDRLFTIGNGIDNAHRHNALTILKNGDFIIDHDRVPANGVNTTKYFMFYDHSKSAFRGGRLDNSRNWAPDSIGVGSFAYGHNVKAIGDYATAMGNYTDAIGDYATAMGAYTDATGDYATAMGYGTKATGFSSTAMGYFTDAIGDKSTAMGEYTDASGYSSTAMGAYTDATGDYATAMGRSTDATGNYATAMGFYTLAPSNRETTIGSYNTNYTPMSSTAWSSGDRLFTIGNGIDNAHRHNALTILKNGDFIIDHDTVPANGVYTTKDFMFYDHSKSAFRGGRLDNSRNWAPDSIGVGSFAYGHNVKAIGDYATAMGAYTDASGISSTAMGYFTDAIGDYATAMGYDTKATGDASTAMGYSTGATGYSSTAMGNSTYAIGDYATAMGYFTLAPSYNETTLGRYSTNYAPISSTAWSLGDRLFTIGNGIDNANRHNALTILKNGNATFGADIDLEDGTLSIVKNSIYNRGHIELTETEGNDGTRIMFKNEVETDNEWTLWGKADNTEEDAFYNVHYTDQGNILVVRGNGKVGIKRNPNTNTLEVNGTASKSSPGSWLANSDRRLKKNINTINQKEALHKLLSLRGVTYEWNDNKTGNTRPAGLQYGFIAQELMEVFPRKVSKDNLGFYQTAYGDYDPLFVQAIKEMNTQNDSQQQQINDLISQLKKQEKLIEKLTQKIISLER